ncbi:hypothetical protein PV326_007707 [Microctonus aethiopoides]|nr:hypothetical protein PV326_007707 [Microctonus aethiopoides]
MDIKDLEVVGIIGFDGITKHGLQLHPDNEHLIYSTGHKITIKNIENNTQDFLSGHTNVVTTISVSPCGKYIASGQLTHLEFKAMVIIWNYESREKKGSYELHKGQVLDVCFTCKSGFLISLGGRDDGNIIIWDIQKNMPICGIYASTEIAGNALTIARTNNRDQCFLTGGDGTLKVWHINSNARKVIGTNIKVGKLRRSINCIAIDKNDENAYCGTSTGDIIAIRLNYDSDLNRVEPIQPPVLVGCYSKIPTNVQVMKKGELFCNGVTSLLWLSAKKLLVGTGDGTIEIVQIVPPPYFKQSFKLPSTPQLQSRAAAALRGAVTSIDNYINHSVIIGTAECEIYQINLKKFDIQVVLTCHIDAVYDVAFPENFSEVFATGSKNDIRLWQIATQREMLRITVPNFVCTSLCFSYDGKLILSAWNDGVIRAFKPLSGKLIFAIDNAHLKAVSAIKITKNGKTLISGGCDGQVRIWEISKKFQRLKASLKEHRAPITALHIAENGEDVVSSSTDGTCIIWDIVNCSRKQIIIGNTMYMSVQFTPNNVQILTCGSDRKIAYWETLDGSLVREVEGTSVGSVNCIDISADGCYFVTGGNDCLVKFWDYMLGEIIHVGVGHAAIVTACRFSSDNKFIVTTSSDGAIIIWNSPVQLIQSHDHIESSRSMERSEVSSIKVPSQTNSKEEIADNVTKRSVDNSESVRTVHESKKDDEPCEYDAIQPAKNSCQCATKQVPSLPTRDVNSPWSKSDGYYRQRASEFEKRRSRDSNDARTSGKANVCVRMSAHN